MVTHKTESRFAVPPVLYPGRPAYFHFAWPGTTDGDISTPPVGGPEVPPRIVSV